MDADRSEDAAAERLGSGRARTHLRAQRLRRWRNTTSLLCSCALRSIVDGKTIQRRTASWSWRSHTRSLLDSLPLFAPGSTSGPGGSRRPRMCTAVANWVPCRNGRLRIRPPPPLPRRNTAPCHKRCKPPCLRWAGTFPPRSRRMAWPGWLMIAPPRTASPSYSFRDSASPRRMWSASWRRRCTTSLLSN